MVALRKPRGLIFDLDGLLVDSEPIWFEVEGGFLRELGHEWTEHDAASCMGQGTPNTLRIWRERFGVEVDIPRDTERIVDRMIARAKDMRLKAGALDTVRAGQRAGVPMAVASSSPRRLIDAVLEAKGLTTFMRAVVSGQEVPRGKPAPDVFLRAAELIGVSASECVVLEDALAGARAGVAAGARVLAVPTIPDPAFRELATWVLDDLREAPAILFGSDQPPSS